MRRTIIIRDRGMDTGFGRIEVLVSIDGLKSSVGTNDETVVGGIVKKALAGEYDRCIEANEEPRLEG